MIVLGLDPSSKKTGWAVIEDLGFDWSLVDAGVIEAKYNWSRVEQLDHISIGAGTLCREYHPDFGAIETPFVHPKHRLDTAIVLGEVLGVIKLTCHKACLVTAVFPPSTVKKAITGKGNASKAQVQQAVKTIFGQQLPPDAADAVAVAVCFINANRAANVAKMEGHR